MAKKGGGGPGGPEVGRVSVRVAPDTSKFGSQLKRDLTKKKMEELSREGNAYPIKFETDQVSLKRAINSIRVPEIFVPVNFDRKQIKAALDKAIEKRVTANRVGLLVKFDRKQAKAALDKLVAGLTLDRQKVAVEIVGSAVAEDLRRAVDTADDNVRARVPIEVDNSSQRQFSNHVSTITQEAVRRASANAEVDVRFDANRDLLDQQIQRAQADLKVFEQNATFAKLDADKRALDFKIDQARREVAELQARGAQIIIDGNIEPLLRDVDRIDQQIIRLNQQEITPKAAIRLAEFERDRERLLAQIESLRNQDVTVEAQARVADAMAKLAALELQASKIDGRVLRMTAQVDGDHTITARNGESLGGTFASGAARGVLGALRVLAGAIGSMFNSMFNSLPEAMDRSFSQVGKGLDDLSSQFDNVGKKGKAGAGAIVEALVTIVQAGITATLAITRLGAVSFALIVAGAGISAAWGAAATAIMAVPAAISLIGAPLGTVLLGMDGIKKAAEVLKPTFEDLKKSVSNAFEKGLAPAMQNVKSLIEDLKPSFVSMAEFLSEMAVDLSKFLSESQQVKDIQYAFEGVEVAVRNMMPGIKDLLSAIIDLAGERTALDAIARTVNELGTGLKEAMDRLRESGDLQNAFIGLGSVLEALTRGFIGLVENGMKLFAAAAPGVTDFLDDLTNFFGKFDWTRLGTAVGDVFRGLGEAIDKIPQSTIDDIVASFEALGDLFQDPDFQQNLADFAEAIPPILDLMGQLADMFATVGSFVSGFIEDMGKVNEWLGEFGGKVAELMKGDLGQLGDILLDLFGDAFEKLTGISVEEELKPLNDKFKKWWSELDVGEWLKGLANDVEEWLGKVWDGIEVSAAFKPLIDKIKAWWNELDVKEWLFNFPQKLKEALTGKTAEVDPEPVNKPLGEKFRAWWEGLDLTSWFTSLGPKLTTALTGETGKVDPEATNRPLSDRISEWWNSLDISTWLSTLGQKLMTALGLQNEQVDPEVANRPLVDRITEWWNNLDISTWFTTIGQKIMTALGLQNQQVDPEATNRPLFDRISEWWNNLDISGWFLTMGQKIMEALGLQNLLVDPEATNRPLSDRISEWWTNLDLSTWFSTIGQRIMTALGLQNQQVDPEATNRPLTNRIGEWWNNLDVASWFTGLPEKVRSAIEIALGGIAPLGFFRSMFDNITAFFNGHDPTPEVGAYPPAVERALQPGMEDAGANTTQTLADAIERGQSRVINAIITLANAVINFTKGIFGIGSPSKVFAGIGGDVIAGLVNGLEDNSGKAVSAMGTVTNSMLRAAENSGSSIADALASGVDGRTDAISSAAKEMVHQAEKYANQATTALSDIAADPAITDWSGLHRASAMAASAPQSGQGNAPLIENLNVQTTKSASADQILDSALFKLRHYRRGAKP